MCFRLRRLAESSDLGPEAALEPREPVTHLREGVLHVILQDLLTKTLRKRLRRGENRRPKGAIGHAGGRMQLQGGPHELLEAHRARVVAV